jgi:hypothetical protein
MFASQSRASSGEKVPSRGIILVSMDLLLFLFLIPKRILHFHGLFPLSYYIETVTRFFYLGDPCLTAGFEKWKGPWLRKKNC